MSADTLDQDTTNGERVFGERYAVAPDFLLKAAVSCNAKMLWLAYQRHADPDGRCFPSRKRVAAEYMNGVSIDTVKKAKRELIEAGLIAVDERYDAADNGRRTSDFVTLLRPPRTRVPMGAKSIPTPRYQKSTDVSSNHQEVSNPPKPPLRDVTELVPRRRVRASRRLGDDRSTEHVPRPSREEGNAPQEKRTPDPPRVPLYAEVNPIVHGNQLEPLTDQYVAVGLEQIRALKAAQYHPTVLDPKGAS